MVVREWDSFCACPLPPPPSASVSTAFTSTSDHWSSIMAPLVESFESLMPGLHPDDNLPSNCKSFALRSSHFRTCCPVPSLWLEEQHSPHILQWLGSSDCSISRLIVAGPHSSQSISSILTTLHKSWPNSHIRHLVLYNLSLDADHWRQLTEMFTRSKCLLQSLALLHPQPPIDALVPSLVQILQDSSSMISELIVHGTSKGIGHKRSFKNLLHVLRNQTSTLRRLSLTSCRLKDSDIEDISALLKSADCKLTALNLSANFFTEIGLHHLQEALIERGQKLSSYNNEFSQLEMLSLCGSPLYLRDKEVTKAMAKVMESPGSSLKTLDLTGRSADLEWISNLSQILQKGSCKMKSLYQFHASYISSDQAASHEKLINALKSNRYITKLQFPWATEAYQQIAHTLLERNARLDSTGLVNERMVIPRCAKLFLCGHEEAGKSTLRKNLLKPSRLRRAGRRVKAAIMKRSATQGMKLCVLPLPDSHSSLVICDLAGQREYHALHHFFMTSSNEGLFAVVCKYEEVDGSQRDREGFRMRLEYWLRFIVSHRTPSHLVKPRVVLVVNFFNCGKKEAQMLQVIAENITEGAVKKYGDLLDFELNGASNVFGVKLNSINSDLCSTIRIKSRVEDLTAALLREGNPVFEICEDIASVVREGRKEFPLVMPLGRLLDAYAAACSQARQGESGRRCTAPSSDAAFEAALLELHKIGQIVFFKSAEATMMHDQLVILNPMWFYETLVGAFVKPMITHGDSRSSHGRQAHGVWREEDIRLAIINRGVCDKNLVDKILGYLEKLELFFVVEEDQQAGSRQLLFPTILPDAADSHLLHAWHLQRNASSFSFFGRRLECEDSERSLLPWGVFTRLQVQLHAVYGRSKQYDYRVGYGWITFTKDEVDVLIRFGGAGSHWEDHHWIDIMVRFSSTSAKCRAVLELEAEATICKTKNLVFQICQGLERGCSGVTLQEYVILADSATEVLLLSKVEEEVRLEGIQSESCSFTHARHGRNSAWYKFFLPAELKKLSLQNMAIIKELREDFALKDDAQSELVLADQLSSKERRVYELFKDNRGVNHSAGLMSQVVEMFDCERASLYARVSEQVLRMQVGGPHALPICPYLVDDKGKWQKLKSMMQLKQARLHLMCQSFEGCHSVKHQKGVVVTLSSPEWLAKLAPVLVPGLRLMYGAVRIGAAFFLPGSDAFMPGSSTLLSALGVPEKVCIQRHDEAFPQLLTSFVEGIPDVPHNLAHLQASPLALLEEFYKFVLEGLEREVDMEQDFSLQRVYFPQKERSFWVCRLHRDGGQIVASSVNPFQSI